MRAACSSRRGWAPVGGRGGFVLGPWRTAHRGSASSRAAGRRRVRPAGESPVRVSAGAPGSRPRLGERSRGPSGVSRASLEGASARAATAASSTETIGEPSRSCHGEGHVRQSWFRIGCGGSPRGTGSCTRARSDRGTRETRLSSLVSKDRSYKPMVKSSGGQRESDGVVVVMIGVKLKAPGAKGPDFGHGCGGR